MSYSSSPLFILSAPIYRFDSDQSYDSDSYLKSEDYDSEEQLQELESLAEEPKYRLFTETAEDNGLSEGWSKERIAAHVRQVIADRFKSLKTPTIITKSDSKLPCRIAYNPKNQKAYIFKKQVSENPIQNSRRILIAWDTDTQSKVVLKGIKDPNPSEELDINKILSKRKDLFVATAEIHNYESLLKKNKDDSITILVLEYLKRNLYDQLNKLSLQDKISIAGDIAEGLAFMHDEYFVHRNLKLEHIFLAQSNDEKKYQAKIANFKDSCFQGHIPTRGKGSEYYTPPEWNKNNYSEADFPSDVWSFGVILLFMFGGNEIYRSWCGLWEDSKHQSETFYLSRKVILEKMKEENMNHAYLFQFITCLISQCLEVNLNDRIKAKEIVKRMNEIKNIDTKPLHTSHRSTYSGFSLHATD